MTEAQASETSHNRKAFSRSVGLLSLFVLMFMCLGAPSAHAPGASPETKEQDTRLAPPAKVSSNLGASDLFAALAEPDLSAEIGALRAIRRELTDTDDPRARDAARDHLDALLDLEERREPDVPAALVMSSLAARIDNAIAALEQAAHNGPAAGNLPYFQHIVPLAVVTTLIGVFIAAGLGAGLGGRRRFVEALGPMRLDFAAATRDLNVATAHTRQMQASAAPTIDSAVMAAKDATLATSRLTSTVMEAEMRLRDCLETIELGQAKAAELAADSDRITQNLPNVLAGAIESMTARGLGHLEDGTQKLTEISREFAVSISQLSERDAVAGDEPPLAKLTLEGIEAIGDAVARIETCLNALPELAHTMAELKRISAGSASETTPPVESGTTANQATETLERLIQRANGLVELLPEVVANLAAAAAQIRRDSQGSGETIASMCERLGKAAEMVAAAGRVAEDNIGNINKAMEAQEELALLLPKAANAVTDTLNELQGASKTSTAATQHMLETMHSMSRLDAEVQLNSKTMSIQHAARIAELDTLLRSGVTALATLPTEAARLTQIASALPQCSSDLAETAASLNREADRLSAAAQAQSEAGIEAARVVSMLVAEIPAATATLLDASGQSVADVAQAASCLRETIVDMKDEANRRDALLAALACRADAAVSALPAEMAQLVSTSALLQQDAGHMLQAARRLEDALSLRDASEAQRAASLVDRIDARFDLAADIAAKVADPVESIQADAAALTQQLQDTVCMVRNASESLACCAYDAITRTAEAGRLAAVEAAPMRDAMVEQTDRLSGLVTHFEKEVRLLQTQARIDLEHCRSPLAELEAAVSKTMAAANRLNDCSDTQAQASLKTAQYALELARAASPATPTPSLSWFEDLADQTRALLQVSGQVAEATLRGEISSIPPDIKANMPAVLAAIERSIDGLRGTATALALASDTARVAA